MILFFRIYNLVSQYGPVKKIIFSCLGGEDNVCRVIMASPTAAGLLQRSMFNQEIEGEFIQVKLATIGEEDFSPENFELEDGSRSWKVFEEEENDDSPSQW